MLMQVAQYTTAKEVWNSIKVKHLGANLVQKERLQTLRSELETLKMKPHESISEFGGKISSIQAKFKSLGGTLKDKVLVRKLLNSFPKKFLPIVASIKQYQEIDTMQFEEAVGRITAFEERLKSQDEPKNNYQNKLLLASSNNQRGGRGHERNFTKNKSSYGKDENSVYRQKEIFILRDPTQEDPREALPRDSPLAFDMSNSILKLTETEDTKSKRPQVSALNASIRGPPSSKPLMPLESHYAQLKPDVTITSADLPYYGSISILKEVDFCEKIKKAAVLVSGKTNLSGGKIYMNQNSGGEESHLLIETSGRGAT
uniref:Zinc finger, CCHC-type n=1 Tax=Tanacetum cinerariifolium TaxID=118510 RepID=A0A6L2N2R1_TANCI|nr:zinc finger, CCHC-type [Tanacetum cinerariifolium]